MERYYKILGISSGASKEKIKEAYHTKMKALHPDKVHGTSLEDTATFFAAEINEAYNYLMLHFDESNYNNQQSASESTSNQKKERRYLESDIFIESYGVLRYSLSDDINIIKNAILKRTGKQICDEVEWSLNTGLSENVKRSMNMHNVNYSMTTYIEYSYRRVVINKRSGNNWYIAAYEVYIREQPKANVRPKAKVNPKPNVKQKTKAKRNRTGLGIVILAVIFLPFLWNAWKNDSGRNNHQKSTRTIASAKAASSNTNISEHANIDKTLRIVAEHLRKKIDINGDGFTNYIDAAVLFYQHYPDKNKVCIEYNYNQKTDMNHLFNCVFTNGVWKAVEPQAYFNNNSSYWMWAVWGSKYDSRYNSDVTEKWKKYVKM